MAKKKQSRNRSKKKTAAPEKKTLGSLAPQHRFFLNPYEDSRFTKCPQCLENTKIRKFPFGIHIDPDVLVTFNLSGPYCPGCDLIILHQDKVESLLTMAVMERDPSVIGNDYLILGTFERNYWRKVSKQGGTAQGFFDNLHDFEEVLIFDPIHPVWMLDNKDADQTIPKSKN
jgi:hypothetical protein